ncbi:MAG: hypothetical protein K2H91_05215 [Lachnospiraceae bacterium]|nr:hypothetical protein [Lachnospiraceae bacterium]
MKRFFMLLSCMCFLLCSCGKNDKHYYYMEEEITSFVQEHEEELRKQIENAGQDDTIKEFDGIQRVEDRRDSWGVVYYEYDVSGLMSSSLQVGFYYSEEDAPSSHGGASWAGGYGWSEVSTQKENLWRYEEDNGDNYLITRKICDNFYYVAAAN